MTNIISQIDNRIIDLANVMGVKILTVKEYMELEDQNLTVFMVMAVPAWYDSKLDVVVINPNAAQMPTFKDAVNSLALHELVHATGHKNRLCRLSITTRHEIATEETLAQSLAHILCSQFGYGSQELNEYTALYLASYREFTNPAYLVAWSEDALAYINQRLNQKVAA